MDEVGWNRAFIAGTLVGIILSAVMVGVVLGLPGTQPDALTARLLADENTIEAHFLGNKDNGEIFYRMYSDTGRLSFFVMETHPHAFFDLLLRDKNGNVVAFFNQPSANTKLHYWDGELHDFDGNFLDNVWYIYELERVDEGHYNFFWRNADGSLIDSVVGATTGSPWGEWVVVELYHNDQSYSRPVVYWSPIGLIRELD